MQCLGVLDYPQLRGVIRWMATRLGLKKVLWEQRVCLRERAATPGEPSPAFKAVEDQGVLSVLGDIAT